MIEYLEQSWEPFFVYTPFLGTLFQDFKYHLYPDNSQVYVTSVSVFPELKTHVPVFTGYLLLGI